MNRTDKEGIGRYNLNKLQRIEMRYSSTCLHIRNDFIEGSEPELVGFHCHWKTSSTVLNIANKMRDKKARLLL